MYGPYRIAKRYADRPQWAISYDFFNEPAYVNRDHWNEIIRKLNIPSYRLEAAERAKEGKPTTT